MSKVYSSITGRVGRDPENKPTKIGDVLKFSVAQKTGYGENDTRWINIAVFNAGLQARRAEIHKGALVATEGWLEEKQLDNATKVYDLVADRLGVVEWFAITKKNQTAQPQATTGGYSADL